MPCENSKKYILKNMEKKFQMSKQKSWALIS